MIRVLLLICFLAGVPASALVETPVSPLTFTPIPSLGPPALATDGENYFAVWHDRRDAARPGLYGARITPERRLLDPVGVRLMDGIETPPAVAYGDGRYAVIDRNLRFVIVDREVNVLARGRVAEETATSVQLFFNGREFLAFWDAQERELRTAAINVEGNVVREPATLLEGGAVALHALASDGTRILITYSRGTSLYVAATSMTATPQWLDRLIATDTHPWARSSIAAAGGSFLVTWRAPENVQAARLDAEGRVVAGPRVVIPWQAPAVQVVGTGGGFRMFEAQELRVMSYDIRADLLTPAVVPVIDRPRPWRTGWFTAIAGPGGTFVLAQMWNPNSESGLYAADGDLQAEMLPVSRAGTTQHMPDVAAGDHGTVVVWREEDQRRVRAAFAGAEAAPLDIGAAEFAFGPSVAVQGDTYLVAWSDRDAARVRLLRDGALFGPAITLSEHGFLPVAASDGRDFVVTWVVGRFLRIARITTSGDIIATAEVPYQTVVRVPVPDIACDQGRCVLVWAEQIPLTPGCFNFRCSYQEQVTALPLDAELRPVYATPLVLGTRGHQFSVASDAGTYAVTWESFEVVHARTIGRGGTLGKLLSLPGRNPAVARHAGAWLLVREVGEDLVAAQFDSAGVRSERVLLRGG